MKKTLLATAAVALVLAMPAAGNALSLSVNLGANTSGGATVGGAGVSANGGASVDATTQANASGNGGSGASGAGGSASATANGNVSESSVLTAFNSDQAALQAIANLGADSNVQVLRIGSMVSANANAFSQAISDSSSASAQLQTAINANADLSAQLGQNNIDVSTLVAADVDANGTLVLYSNS